MIEKQNSFRKVLFEQMVCRADLVEVGFRPNQANFMVREAKKYLYNVEGVEFYGNPQVKVVPGRIIEKLFHVQLVAQDVK